MRRCILLLCITWLLAGCDCNPVTVLDQDQPLVGPGEQGRATGRACGFGADSWHELEWRDHRGKTYNAEKVLAQCEAYLRKRELWDTWRQVAPKTTTFPTHITQGKYIVCLRPLVVLGPVGRDIATYHFARRYFRSRVGYAPQEIINARWLALPGYFFVGTHVPYRDELQWFSPDLKIGPQPLRQVQVGEGEYLIPVPWGALRLRRQDGELIVTGEAGKENQ